MKPTILSVLGSILLSACSIGRGDGFVRGNLALTQCRQGDALEAPDFDLGAEFFFGDPLIDFDDSVELRRSSLTIRIQDTSNRLETSDGLMLLLPDLRYAARAYADARPLSADDCFESGGCPTEDYSRVRAKLSLFNSCPDNRSPIVAAPRDVVRKNVVAADNCLRSDTVRAACPTLSPAQLAELDEICAGDLNDANAIQPRIEAILGQGAESGSDRVGGPACLYLCSIGSVQRGDSADALQTHQFAYDDEVAGLFFFNVVDGRAITLEQCAASSGQLAGAFRFRLSRNRVAQAFP
ncbi:MAG: hypothetical protein H6707_08605 [Deltaproteobacteria bacterium]|nr:hypothetical protein [Deltaproteobacteria bacterium]